MLAEFYDTVPTSYAIVAVIITSYFIYRTTRKKYNLPPGPAPWPVLGNLLVLRGVRNGYTAFSDLAKQYGDVFTMYMGPKCNIILNSMESIRETYLKQPGEFGNRPKMFTAEQVSIGHYKSITMGQQNAAWKLQRKIAHAALRKYATGRPLEKLMQDKITDFYKSVELEEGKPFDIYPKITFLIYNVIGSMVMGKTFEPDDPWIINFIKDIDMVNESIGNGFLADIYPIFKYFPNKLASRIKRMMRTMADFMQGSWDEHQAAYNPDELTDFIYYLIAAKQEMLREGGEEDPAVLDDEHYLNILIDIFFAGTDTSRMTLWWVVGLCAQYPEIQAKIHKEIDEAVGRDTMLCLKHRPLLPYTEAVLHEAMRLYPVAPLGVPRATSVDVQLRDWTIPAGTWVMPNIWALHRDPAEWKNPEQFIPERHLDEHGKLASKPNSFLPFSTGRRSCVGESVAKAELHLLTAMLFQHYSFLPPADKKEGFEVELMEGFMICMPKVFQVVATHRE